MQPGDTFGDWTVIERTDRKTKSGNFFWLCRCKCGNTSEILPVSLRKGRSSRCNSCAAKLRTPHIKHGHSSASGASPTYKTWNAMIARCTNPNHAAYDKYGGDGVRVCDRWLDFSNFLEDMGARNPKFVIDRLNDSAATKHYSCGHCPQCKRNGWKFHCRWVSRTDSASNRAGFTRLITHNGKTQTVSAWSRETGVPYPTLIGRLNRGWPTDKAMTPYDYL